MAEIGQNKFGGDSGGDGQVVETGKAVFVELYKNINIILNYHYNLFICVLRMP